MRSALATIALLLVAASGTAQGSGADHVEHRHRMVRIRNASLHPTVQRLSADDAIGWLNYSDKVARVSFEASVARKMTCTSPSGFRVTGDRLESPGIQAQQFAAVCRLEPGEYTYRVQLQDGIGASGMTRGRSFEGKLLVEGSERPG
jgi:hypothetical protein